ncbi:hypothetical protein C8J57DRAFT_1445548 [Mycena rebaudengoi]|nr:hypothetical protein C8J57DRAFT_1445548 [Mycena rebaudengoi]
MSNTIPQQPNGTPHALEEPEITRLWRVFVSQVPKLPLPRKTKTSPIPQVLKVSPEERKSMEERERVFGLDFRQFTNAIDQQDSALELLISLGAHIPSEITRDVCSKLVIRTSDSNDINSINKNTKFVRWRRIYQCICGSDHQEGNRAGTRRDMPYQNVGCAFWIKLTTTHHGKDMILTIDEITGNFTHSDACQEITTMDKDPRIPLHPDLRSYALSLFRIRVPLSQVKQLCREFAQKKWGAVSGNNSFRFVLNDHETTSLYRTLARERGMPQAPPQDNLDSWFRKKTPTPPDPRLTASCLSYKPHIIGETERFSLIISTPEQKLMAWRYGHKKQFLMDLTFGVCSGRVLLAILMVLDEEGHGLPVGQFLFSAKQEAKAVHADNGKLLEELIGDWQRGMGKNGDGEEMDVSVAGTDNDPRERYGLTEKFPHILLLLCMFHTWQAWRNGLNKHLRVIPAGDDRQSIRRRLAVAAYNEELEYFRSLTRRRDNLSKQQGKGGLAFLAYLASYLKLRSFWLSWSLAGAIEAARKMGVAVSEVARTTNALESWNGRLKGKYISHHMHSGRLPRVDHWIFLLITEILPTFFAEWAEKRQRAHVALSVLDQRETVS